MHVLMCRFVHIIVFSALLMHSIKMLKCSRADFLMYFSYNAQSLPC